MSAEIHCIASWHSSTMFACSMLVATLCADESLCRQSSQADRLADLFHDHVAWTSIPGVLPDRILQYLADRLTCFA